MPIAPRDLLARVLPDVTQDFEWRDAALYALSVGLGAQPTDPRIGRFLHGEPSVALPSFVNVLGVRPSWIKALDLGIDYSKVLHAEHRFEIHGPIPARGQVKSVSRIVDVTDKGRATGALITFERQLFLMPARTLLATIRHTTLARGDGGFADPAAPASAPPRPAPPDRDPDISAHVPIRPEAGLLFRLNGDLNPLHADPAAAARAGFDRPPLHGLATFGMASSALLDRLCDLDPAGLGSMSGRFSAPVFPGETLRVDMWVEGRTARFQAVVEARGARAITHGHATLAA